MSKIKWKGQNFTYQVNQNIIGDTFSRLDLAEISASKVDQEPKIRIRDCIKSSVLF